METALRRLGAEPGDAVVVGDSPADMAAATAAGARGFGVAWGFSAPDELTAAGASVVVADCVRLLEAILSPVG